MLFVASLAMPGLGAVAQPALDAQDRQGEIPRLHFVPPGPSWFGIRTIFLPLSIPFGGKAKWYGPRTVRIETIPAGGEVDLFYIRSTFQKRYEHVRTPVIVELPRRVDADPRDVIQVRVGREGYRGQETHFNVTDDTEEIVFELDPVPNRLEYISHTVFGLRGGLVFWTEEQPTVRLQDTREGMSLIFLATAKGEELEPQARSLQSRLLRSIDVRQLGEDLLIRIRLDGEMEYRTRLTHDLARGKYRFTLDLRPVEGIEGAVEEVWAGLTALTQNDVTGCALRFEQTLRGELDAAALARALAPRGEFTDPVLRAAMRRLGELTPSGRVQFENGTSYDTAIPIELEAALSRAAEAEGYLALLRRLAELLDPTPEWEVAYRGLVAPELSREPFAVVLGGAEEAERNCTQVGLVK